MLAATFVGVPGYYEVERSVAGYGGLTVICTPGWRGVEDSCLLMPDRIRERWKDLVDELSAYYNTPERLAVIRRQFENARRRPGLDPATFATELGILALRGFSNMKEKAQDLMVRNKFIVAQQSCDLRRHLDGAAPEASIEDIIDSCCIWESHAEPIAIDNWWQDPVYSQPMLLRPPPTTYGSARLQYRVGWMTLIDPDGPQTPMVFQHWGASLRLKTKRRVHAIPDSGSAVVARNSTLDSILRSKRDGGHRAM